MLITDSKDLLPIFIGDERRLGRDDERSNGGSTDPHGLAVFEVTKKRDVEVASAEYNTWTRKGRVNQASPNYERATPIEAGWPHPPPKIGQSAERQVPHRQEVDHWSPFMQRTFLVSLATAAVTVAFTPAALAQDAAAQLAAKPFTIVAPFPPGGPVDVLARMLADGLAAQYKQTAVVENKPGAHGNIGITQVKRSAATGHTLLVIPAGNLTINPTLLANPGYDVDADFTPVSSMARASNVVAVNPSVPATNIAQLVALAKAKPNSMAYASPGVGSQLHLAGELLGQQTGADFLHVAYKGTAPGLTDVLSGTVPMIIGNIPALLPHIQSGKLRPLALTDGTRDSLLPQVPTLLEAGVQGINVTSWYGVLAPKATPPAVVEQLARDLARIVNEPANQTRMRGLGLQTWVVPTAAFGDVIRKETAIWAPIIRDRKIEAR